jgi:hypothetical protein
MKSNSRSEVGDSDDDRGVGQVRQVKQVRQVRHVRHVI